MDRVPTAIPRDLERQSPDTRPGAPDPRWHGAGGGGCDDQAVRGGSTARAAQSAPGRDGRPCGDPAVIALAALPAGWTRHIGTSRHGMERERMAHPHPRPADAGRALDPASQRRRVVRCAGRVASNPVLLRRDGLPRRGAERPALAAMRVRCRVPLLVPVVVMALAVFKVGREGRSALAGQADPGSECTGSSRSTAGAVRRERATNSSHRQLIA